MKKTILTTAIALAAVMPYTSVHAQSGIGTVAPQPSAILDVAATNKGLLIPRMNTAAVAGILSPADGLMVYDSAARQVLYYKTGSGWKPVSRFALTYTDTANSGSPAFNITNTGIGSGISGVNTGTGTSYGVEGTMSNASNSDANAAGVKGYFSGTNGSGVMGAAPNGIGVNGVSNTGTAVSGSSITGTAVAASSFNGVGVNASSTNGTGVNGVSSTSYGVNGFSSTGYAVYGLSPSGVGGQFSVSGTTNGFPALIANNAGLGIGVSIALSNANNTSEGIYLSHNGKGNGISTVLTNPANINDVLFAQTSGSGKGIRANSNSGIAGYFENTNNANTQPTLAVLSNTTNYTMSVVQNGASGNGAIITTANASSSTPALNVNHAGVGIALDVYASKATNPTPALRAVTNGTSNAVVARSGAGATAVASNAAVWGDAATQGGVYGSSDGGVGVQGYSKNNYAGYFTSTASNTNDVLVTTAQGAGNALTASSSGSGTGVYTTAAGSGQAIRAIASGSGNAIYATAQASSTAYALTAETYAPQHAIALFGSGANSRGMYITVQAGQQAIAINRGRVAYATGTVNGGGTIPSDVTMVMVNNNFVASSIPSVALPTAGMEDGDLLIVASNDPDGVQVTGATAGAISIGFGISRQFIRINGAWFVEF